MSSFLQIVIHIHKPITCTFVTCLVINVLCIMNLPHNHNVLYQGVSPYRRTESMWISFQSSNILPGWFLSLIALRNLFNQNRNFEYVGLEKKNLTVTWIRSVQGKNPSPILATFKRICFASILSLLKLLCTRKMHKYVAVTCLNVCVLSNPLNIGYLVITRPFENTLISVWICLPFYRKLYLQIRIAHCHIWKSVVKDRSNVFLKRIKSLYLGPAVRMRIEKIR